MSATYAAAVRDLNDAAEGTGRNPIERLVGAQVGTGRALLEVAELLEALVELLRPLIEQGETGQDEHPVVPGLKLRPDLTVCPRCLDGLEGRTVRVTTPGDYVVHEDC